MWHVSISTMEVNGFFVSRFLQRHQYEAPKYPWHDYHGCPVDIEPFHHVEPPQLSHQPIPPNAPMASTVPMGDYECHAPIRRKFAPMHGPGTDVQSGEQDDELDSFYKHQFPVVSRLVRLSVPLRLVREMYLYHRG